MLKVYLTDGALIQMRSNNLARAQAEALLLIFVTVVKNAAVIRCSTGRGQTAGLATIRGLGGKSDEEVRAEMGDKFPRLIYHSIVCIGALVAQRREAHWEASAEGATTSASAQKKKSSLHS
jgi:hypothetical protein